LSNPPPQVGVWYGNAQLPHRGLFGMVNKG
jgi:hypothetical protein